MVHRSGLQTTASSSTESFSVLGSTGNVYVMFAAKACAHCPQTVSMGTRPSCDCPDNLKGNSPCKHILFIL